MLASLGCGNPTAVADLHEGETVLDLGSGGGIDVILSAKRVGPDRHRLRARHDRRDARARAAKNAAEAGVANVHFLKGVIEQIPLPADSVDVIISNCVINLSVDKPAVLTEMARVLKPGGRIGISDVVAEDHLSAAERAERGSLRRLHRRRALEGRVRGGARGGGLRAGRRSSSRTRSPTACTARSSRRSRRPSRERKGLPVIQPAAQAGCC